MKEERCIKVEILYHILRNVKFERMGTEEWDKLSNLMYFLDRISLTISCLTEKVRDV